MLPQTELGGDVGALRAYAQGVEALGYAHVMAYDHVVGADPEHYRGWSGPYDVNTTFHEPLVAFGFLAGITKLELVTGVVILPQRQTVLVAKQAAEVDLLSEGRFRLGVGIGWNHVEYEALGEDFHTRGRRLEEQVALLRRLWTEQTVTFEGEFDTVTAAGIAPMPIQRPIPVWFGGSSPRAYERIGRLADGWFPQMLNDADYDAAWSQVSASARAAGRDPSRLGIHARHWVGGPEELTAKIETWRARNATHVAIDTMRIGLRTVDAHLEALTEVAKALDLS